MNVEDVTLTGNRIRLEPLEYRHVDGLVRAAAADREVYRWSFVPQTQAEFETYVETALSWKAAQRALPFAAVRVDDGAIVGSTRFFDLESWYGRDAPDVCEIGYTWLAPGAIRTGANREAKLLMLAHAFETWKAVRVCFHTDARNERSRTALAGIGAQFEGVLRAHRLAVDSTPRDSWRFSIVASEWPRVKERLSQRLATKP
jgi:RimJ/RimL family protein N-acetyltransferase